jgi:hypothetical protein
MSKKKFNLADLAAAVRAVTVLDSEWNPATKHHDPVPIHPTVMECDNFVQVSAEDGKPFADYYGEFRGGYPWIHPELEAVAKKFGLYWEWQNPGAIAVYP